MTSIQHLPPIYFCKPDFKTIVDQWCVHIMAPKLLIYINKYIIILNTCQCIAAFVRQTLNPSPHFCPPYPPYASASHKDTKVSAPSSMPSLCRARHNLEARDASARPQTRNNGRCRPKSWPPLPITYCITALLWIKDPRIKEINDLTDFSSWTRTQNQSPNQTSKACEKIWKLTLINCVSLKFFKNHGQRVLENFDFFQSGSLPRSSAPWSLPSAEKCAAEELGEGCATPAAAWTSDGWMMKDKIMMFSI